MPDLVADPLSPSCYHLFSEARNPGISITCSWSLLAPRTRRARALRQGKLRQPARPHAARGPGARACRAGRASVKAGA